MHHLVVHGLLFRDHLLVAWTRALALPEAELCLPEHSPPVQTACRYVGEVHNRNRGTRWPTDPHPADGHPRSERPYAIVPFARLDEYRDPEGIDFDARHRRRRA
ncbi:hypothetical protein [Streptomyces sp. NPDC047972]|uniref:hypothetical protein n=1 Tax=Streptomyces sp. NPDC047972 TaxID=3365493 RepID=UPI0037200B81